MEKEENGPSNAEKKPCFTRESLERHFLAARCQVVAIMRDFDNTRGCFHIGISCTNTFTKECSAIAYLVQSCLSVTFRSNIINPAAFKIFGSSSDVSSFSRPSFRVVKERIFADGSLSDQTSLRKSTCPPQSRRKMTPGTEPWKIATMTLAVTLLSWPQRTILLVIARYDWSAAGEKRQLGDHKSWVIAA